MRIWCRRLWLEIGGEEASGEQRLSKGRDPLLLDVGKPKPERDWRNKRSKMDILDHNQMHVSSDHAESDGKRDRARDTSWLPSLYVSLSATLSSGTTDSPLPV